jgi:hypothetical protein
MATFISTVNKALPIGATATQKGKDIVVKSKDRDNTKKVVEENFKKRGILFQSIFKKSKSSSIDVLEVTNMGDIIFKPIIQKGAGGLKFEDELKLDLVNYFNGVDFASLKHQDVVKKLESALKFTPADKLVPDKRGGKNQSRALQYAGGKISINNTSGNYITDITLMDPKKTGSAADKYHLSLKMSETFYILNAAIGKYFADRNTQAPICEFFGFNGQRMGGFGEEYACITEPINLNKVKTNLQELLSEAYGYDMVLVHKKREGDVLVKEIKTTPSVTITDLSDDSYRYPDPGVRKYANISFNANVNGTRYKVDFQFRGTTAADRGPRYLRILMKRL